MRKRMQAQTVLEISESIISHVDRYSCVYHKESKLIKSAAIYLIKYIAADLYALNAIHVVLVRG